MNVAEFIRLGVGSLYHARLRTALTTLGVTIGIGCLIALVSLGTGMQKNVSRFFYQRDLFTTLVIAPEPPDMERVMAEGLQAPNENAPVLNDSVLGVMRGLEGVDIAFPEVRFPARIEFEGRETRIQVRAMPTRMGRYPPYSKLLAGSFHRSDSARVVILSTGTLEEMGWVIPETGADTMGGRRPVDPDTLVGKTLTLVTSILGPATFEPTAILQRPAVREHRTRLRIGGILESRGGFAERILGSAIVPAATAQAIPRPDFESVWDLLSGSAFRGYTSVYLRVHDLADVEPVERRIRDMGFGVFSLAGQFAGMKRGFLMLDVLLAAIGIVALVVAGLGIANTMLMSVFERTRDIGIMKAIGASEREIQGIFFAEAALIGVVGGLLGILLGWGVTRVAAGVANAILARQGEPPVDFFYIPIWLVLGGLVFSITVSLAAGLYPAIRASRVDPNEALRHE